MYRAAAVALVLLVHAAVLLPEAAAQSDERLAKARRLQQEAAADLQAGRARDGIPKAREALALREAARGPNHPDVAESAMTLGELLRDSGDAPAAKLLYERALAIRESALGPRHPLTASSLNGLGYVTYLTGDVARGRALVERGLETREQVQGSRHVAVSFSAHTLGIILAAQGHQKEARASYERALTIREQANGPDHPSMAPLLYDVAVLLREMGDRATARAHLQRALAIREAGGNERATAATLHALGQLSLADGDFAGARPLLERALRIREKEYGLEHTTVAESLALLVDALRETSDSPGARAHAERALAIREHLLGANHPLTAGSLHALGYLVYVMGDNAAGRSMLERSLAIRERAVGPDHPSLASGLVDLGVILTSQDHFKEAQTALERALVIRERSLGPDHILTAVVHHNLGETLREAGDRAGARSHLERALKVREASGQPLPVASTLNALGVVSAWDGDFVAARAALERSLAIRERLLGADHLATAVTLNNLGRVLRGAGRYSEARAAFERSLRIREARLGSEHISVGQSLRDLADTLRSAGDVKAARSLLERALPIYETRLGPEHSATAITMRVLGYVVLQQGDLPVARSLYDRALAIQEKVLGPANAEVAVTLRLLSHLNRIAGNKVQARAYAERALRVREQALGPDHPSLAWELNSLGQLHRVDGDQAAARPLLERALALGVKGGLSEIQWRAQFGLGILDERAGKLPDAVARFRGAVGALEQLAGQFDEGARAQFLQGENRLMVYDALARALLRLHERDQSKGYDREAFAALEAKKGRMVAGALAGGQPRVADPKARRQAEDVQAQQARVLAIERALREEQDKAAASQNAQAIKDLTTRLAETKAEYLSQVQAFLARYPKYKTLFVDQQTVDPKVLAKFADRLPPGTLVVQYFSAPDALYLFVVAAGGRFQVKTQPVKQDELYALVATYRQHLAAAERARLPWLDDGSALYLREVAPLKDATAKLSAYLLAPIVQELTAYSNVVFIPNDLLLYLPLHALSRRVDGRARFLAETHVVSYLTQLELLDLLAPAKREADGPLLALANPDGSLPGASGEVRALRRVRSTLTTLEGERATKAEFLKLASGFPQIHLATHGVLDPERPERSYLLVAGPDEASQRLSIAEIAGLSLQRGLAILSACDTAVGEQVPGAALITLAAAFSQAGAEAIVASLWKVNDASTRDFMVTFHRELGAGQAIALQRAQMAILGDPATAHPYYWAAFVLIGAR